MPDNTHPPGVEAAVKSYHSETVDEWPEECDCEACTAFRAGARWAWDAALEAAAKVAQEEDGNERLAERMIRALMHKGQ